MIRIARAQEEDLGKIQGFIRDHWKPGHVLGHDEGLLRWQYGDPDRGGFNIAIGWRGDEVLGILGYIRSLQFERIDRSNPTVWLALWKVRDDARVPGLGLRLERYINDLEKPFLLAVVGFNEAALQIYQRMGYTTGILEHHIFLNREVSNFRIFNPGLGPVPRDIPVAVATRQDLPASTDQVVPRKTASYIHNRYIKHPYYNYNVVSVGGGMLVVRKVNANGACALRIIDGFGPDEMWGGLGSILEELVSSCGAEYIDLMSHGVSPESLACSGFFDVRSFKHWIVPNYFEPFVPKASLLRYAAKVPAGVRYVVFKGDGDHDRPNLPLPRREGIDWTSSLGWEPKNGRR